MQIPSLRVVVFFVARSRDALWTRFFNDFGHHFESQNRLFLGPFLDPRKREAGESNKRSGRARGDSGSGPGSGRGGVYTPSPLAKLAKGIQEIKGLKEQRLEPPL